MEPEVRPRNSLASPCFAKESSADSGGGLKRPERRVHEKEVRVQGLEPWTYGLKVRCSTN